MAILPTPDPTPTPVPTPPPFPDPKPMREPDPERLPDEEPVPNPDENDVPPKHSGALGAGATKPYRCRIDEAAIGRSTDSRHVGRSRRLAL
ncbi:MAG: hypothetical protein E5X33_01645 [Mesorhizobium sp.]|nr:MAG: hypothetical protein EOR22_08205 [Mesorhizobium sp.]TIQ09479.1 MAG: hypothetical protein E5X50_00845 [Mesorhizobium sp.]TIR24589.1 MAG: hypothetical protein E5X33_01645 [Mesorhizobium sp.]